MIGGKVIVTYKRKRAKTDFCHENDLPDKSTECSLTTSNKHEEAADKDTPEDRKNDSEVLVELVEDGIGCNILHSDDCHRPSHGQIISSPKDSTEGKRLCSGCIEEHDPLMPLFNRIRENQLFGKSNTNESAFGFCSFLVESNPVGDVCQNNSSGHVTGDSYAEETLVIDEGGQCSCRDSSPVHEHKCSEKFSLSSSVKRKFEMEPDRAGLKSSLGKDYNVELVSTSAPKTGSSEGTNSTFNDKSHNLGTNAIAENKLNSPLITFHRRSKRVKDVNGPGRESCSQGRYLCSSAVEGSETASIVNAPSIEASGTCSVDISTNSIYSLRNADTGHSISGAQEKKSSQSLDHLGAPAGSAPENNTAIRDEPALSPRSVIEDMPPTVPDKGSQCSLKDDLNTTPVPDGIGSNGGPVASGNLSIPPLDSHCLVDCNIALESDSVEQPTHNLSRVLGNSMDSTSQSTLLPEPPGEKGLTLSIEGIGERLSSDKAQPPEEDSGSVKAFEDEANDCAKVPSKNDCLQLFPENRSNGISSIGREPPELLNCREAKERSDRITESWSMSKPQSTRSPLSLGCPLPVEPKGDVYAQNSVVFQWSNVGFQSKEFFQDSVSQSFSDQTSSLYRHQMMLDNIVNKARTLDGRRSCLENFQTPILWLEEELDSLWVGVRRHGRGNWEAMLRDPRLQFLSWRTPRDLAERWLEEMQKLFNNMPVSHKNFPGTPELLLLDRLNGLFYNKPARESLVNDIQLSLGEVYCQPVDGVQNRSMFKGTDIHDDVRNKFQRPASKSKSYSSSRAIKGRRINKHWESRTVTPSSSPNADPVTQVSVNRNLPHWLKEAVSTPPQPHDPSLLSLPSSFSCSSMQLVDQPFLERDGIRPQLVKTLNGPQANSRTELQIVGGGRYSNLPQVTTNESHQENLIIIDSDASSEETISDDHGVRH